MIKIEYTRTFGWEAAIRGMRNPMNSWDKSDSAIPAAGSPIIGQADRELMAKLAANGAVHAKYRRMIIVTCDITAPLYWWKEYDTYKVGTVANSCSTMHKIHAKPFELSDFSYDHLDTSCGKAGSSLAVLCGVIAELNYWRDRYLMTNDKNDWWQIIQLLPSSYNQKRTVMLSYEVLSNVMKWRQKHKLDEWCDFCRWVKTLPYAEIIGKDE